MTDGSITDRSKARVDDALQRLRETYGDVDVVGETWSFSPAGHEWIVDRFEAGTVGGAGAWIHNEAGEVLLVREAGGDGWSEPGGKHEPGETLAETATREAMEETNVACRVTDVGVAQVTTIEAPEAPPVYRLIPIFLAERTAGTPTPNEEGIREVRWWDTHPPALRYDVLRALPIPATD